LSRYSALAPLTVWEQVKIALAAIAFFSPGHNRKRRQELELPINEQSLVPLSVIDFFKWHKQQTEEDLFPKQSRVVELLSLLSSKKCLQDAGLKATGSPPFNQTYYSMIELTNIEQTGCLFLGRYLGLELIADAVKYNLAYITGKTKNGDEHVGSGILIAPQVILTCAHVLNDMQVNSYVEINAKEYKVKLQESHAIVDLGVIILDEPVSVFCKDIALRNSTLLEKVVVAGFPIIPRKKYVCPMIQSGEIAGRIVSYGEGDNDIQLELFTAISRPGNSGGPLMSADGKLLGIVTQSLEREQEEIDKGQSILPCFAAIPADVVFKSYNELKVAQDFNIPWEDYQ
jgi:S1-C subfamily serine protease